MNTSSPVVDLPSTFLEMPRWWHEGQEWLAALPGLVQTVCQRWDLTLDGSVRHGSNAIVVPVKQQGNALALRMTFPDDRTGDEVRALQFWNGRGTVRIYDADPEVGASLLERLDGTFTLADLPLAEAIPIIARIMRRLAVPDPPNVPCTPDIAAEGAVTLEADWDRLGQPFTRNILDDARNAADRLRHTTSSLAVNGDLHFEQILRGKREPWLTVDPVLLRGDIEYDLARILWSRLDEMTSDSEVLHHANTIIREANLDSTRAHAWIRFRTVSYWLWGLDYGLTEDPFRCARLARIFGTT